MFKLRPFIAYLPIIGIKNTATQEHTPTPAYMRAIFLQNLVHLISFYLDNFAIQIDFSIKTREWCCRSNDLNLIFPCISCHNIRASMAAWTALGRRLPITLNAAILQAKAIGLFRGVSRYDTSPNLLDLESYSKQS